MEPRERPTIWSPPRLEADEPAPPAPTTPVRASGPGPARIGAFIGGCAILLAAAAGALAGSGGPSPSNDGTSASGGTGAPAAAAQAWADGQARLLHAGRLGGALGGGISISAINGSNVSLQTENGWQRTIDASGATITRDGATVQLADLEVGDHVGLHERRNDDGTWTVTQIVVVADRLAGVVADVGDSSLTVRLADGSTRTVTVTASTTYSLGREPATKDALEAGLQVLVAGEDDNGTFTASRVHLAAARLAGIVTAKTDSTITVAIGDGTTRTINVDSSTTYRVAGADNAGLDDIAVNAGVTAVGTLNDDGSLDATQVASGLRGLRGLGDFGLGKGRGHGFGFGPFGDRVPTPDASPDASGDSSDGTS